MHKNTVDFSRLDDSALFSLRAEMRAALERLPPRSQEHADLALAYDASTAEIDERARRAWRRAAQAQGTE